MQKKGSILVIDDNEDLLKAAKMFLKRHFLQVDLLNKPESIPNLMMNETYDIILLDMNFTKDVSSGKEGFYWLERILEIDSSIAVVLITAYGDIQTAVSAIKSGASDFILKPWNNEKLLATLYSSMRLRESKLEIETLRFKQQHLNLRLNERYGNLIGNSQAMREVFDIIDKIAKTDADVLILGENGTGKELIAQAIHRNSNRNKETFVNVDLGSITDTLFESELFGHKKGAFTDAIEDKPGRFELASGGTIFLDEIGNLTLPLQAKLLSVLQNRKVNRVGSNKEIKIDIRLLCATNVNLYKMVEENQFRQDLIYRINTIELKIPPLRERKEDIPLLAQYFIEIYSKKYDKKTLSISEASISRLMKHHWPGNVRELQHAIERAIIMSNQKVLQPEDFNYNNFGKASTNPSLKLGSYRLEEVEKIMIKKALNKYDGNITLTAKELGLTRTSLYRRLEKHGL